MFDVASVGEQEHLVVLPLYLSFRHLVVVMWDEKIDVEYADAVVATKNEIYMMKKSVNAQSGCYSI